jgi:hypothetical protein
MGIEVRGREEGDYMVLGVRNHICGSYKHPEVWGESVEGTRESKL